jgi:hypothetical protein
MNKKALVFLLLALSYYYAEKFYFWLFNNKTQSSKQA